MEVYLITEVEVQFVIKAYSGWVGEKWNRKSEEGGSWREEGDNTVEMGPRWRLWEAYANKIVNVNEMFVYQTLGNF